jgi:hypothetical protein
MEMIQQEVISIPEYAGKFDHFQDNLRDINPVLGYSLDSI